MACAIWLLTAFIFRISSLSALIAAITAPLIAFILGYKAIAIMATVLCVVIYIRHKDNILRILSGDEPKIGAKKKS